MKTKIETITPEYATKVLENHNPRNRKINEQTVSIYATDMKNGRWVITHQGIAFDDAGNLIDGQHRLWAVIFADMNVDMMVTRDIPAQEVKNGVILTAMDAIDRNRVRTTGQGMQLCHNIKAGNNSAAACRAIAFLIYPTGAQKRISMASSLFIYENYGKDIDAILHNVDRNHRVGFIVGPLAMYHHNHPESAVEIAQSMKSLVNMAEPIRLFVKFLDSSHSTNNSGKTMRIFAHCIEVVHRKGTMKQVKDGNSGVEFLTSLSPIRNKKIRESIRTIPVTLKRAIVNP